MFQEVYALGQKVAISRQPPVEWHTWIDDNSGIYKIIDTHIENVSLPQVTDFLSQWSIKSGYQLLVSCSWLILISLHCFFTIVLFMSSVFVSEQSVSNRLLKDRLRSANASCSSSSGPPVPSLCLTGRKAGRVGRWLLGDSVQTFGPSPHGPRPKQLQALCSPQPVCHPQEPVHQRHAGTTQTRCPLSVCL